MGSSGQQRAAVSGKSWAANTCFGYCAVLLLAWGFLVAFAFAMSSAADLYLHFWSLSRPDRSLPTDANANAMTMTMTMDHDPWAMTYSRQQTSRTSALPTLAPSTSFSLPLLPDLGLALSSSLPERSCLSRPVCLPVSQCQPDFSSSQTTVAFGSGGGVWGRAAEAAFLGNLAKCRVYL